MRKVLISVLAVLLTLAVMTGFAACNSKPSDNPTQPDTSADETLPAAVTQPQSGDEDSTEPTGDEDTTEPTGEDTTVDTSDVVTGAETTETTKEGATPVTQAIAVTKDPTTMAKAELLDYFNTAVNAVRSQKPQFDYEIIRKIDKVETTILGGVVDGIVNAVVKKLMPGTPETGTVAKGSGNLGKFLNDSDSKASLLTVAQISSITAVKKGANYEVTVKLPPATNPSMTAGQSSYSSLHQIQDPKGIVDAIVGENDTIKADPATTTLNYKNGYATIVVNQAGQLQSMVGGFNVDAVGKEWSVSFLHGDVTAMQSTSVKAFNFVW